MRDAALFDDLIRPLQERRRDGEAEGLGGLEIDDELEFCRLLDREVCRLCPTQDLRHIGSGASIEIRDVGSEAHEGARLRPRSGSADGREAVLRGKLKETRAEWISGDM